MWVYLLLKGSEVCWSLLLLLLLLWQLEARWRWGSSVACSYTHKSMLVSRHSLSSTHMCCCAAWHHTPLPCRWKKQGHWCVEKNRGERGEGE